MTTAFAVLYFASHCFLVRPALRNSFVRWRGDPLLLYPTYRVGGPMMREFYRPLAQLDQQVFPSRWQWQPSEESRRNWTNSMMKIDITKIHEAALKQRLPEVAPDHSSSAQEAPKRE